MKWIFLSPHLDDIAFSCGGLVWDLTQAGHDAEIWTITAGDPPGDDLSPLAEELHLNWGLGMDAVQIRRAEDQQACQTMGAEPRYFSYLDCIYRKDTDGKYFYASEEAIFGGLHPHEAGLINRLAAEILEEIPEGARVVAPLGIGNHVDHELVRKAANRSGIPLLFYADYPYAREADGKDTLQFLERSTEWQGDEFPISEAGLDKWILAAQAYRSQISTFWAGDEDLEKQVRDFSYHLGTFKLWKAVENP